MKPEDKELLYRDLCSRLPYGVKILAKYVDGSDAKEKEGKGRLALIDSDLVVAFIDEIEDNNSFTYIALHEVKPYLFPMSSMTEEQKREYNSLRDFVPTYHYEFGDIVEDTELYDNFESIDYLIANHFDYRGLIPMELAIDCTNLDIY